MIPRKEALATIIDSVKTSTVTEDVPLSRSAGRVLAKDALSDINVPPFNRVTMDGYAVVAADGPGEYRVVDYVPAGVTPKIKIRAGEVARVMTGAPLPDGADAVIQVEKSGGFVEVGETAVIKEGVTAGRNVSTMGEDFKIGDKVLDAPRVIGASDIAVLSSVGIDPVKVIKRPTVAILATGDELVSPSEKPKEGQIRNSSSYSLAAQVNRAGGEPILLGIGGDTKEKLSSKVSEGSKYDFLIVTGGVSAGDRDFAPEIISDNGYNIKFRKIKIKPGKPTLFGHISNEKFVFGLPGNPVSTFFIFEIFTKVALKKFLGLPVNSYETVTATLGYDIKRKSTEREEFVPVNLQWNEGRYLAESTGYHGSAHVHAITSSNGFIIVPSGVSSIATGATIEAFHIER